MTGVGEDELFHLDENSFRAEFVEDNGGNFVGERFKEFEGLRGAELNDALGDVVVVDSGDDVIGKAGFGEVAVHFDGDEEALGFGTFFVGDADMAEHRQVLDADDVHASGWGCYRCRRGGGQPVGG